jgi:tetratricopeptide (TPR) repeat protein
MRILTLFGLILLCTELTAQFNALTTPLVYHIPAMDKVTVLKQVYKIVHQDTILNFDIYYPPAFDKKKNLPVVVFNNGVGSMEVPEWQIYKDWARLMAANGMIAINHQSRQGKTQKDLEDLLEHLRKQSEELKIDKDNMGVWVCSANSQTGWPVVNDPKHDFIKAIAIYYGVTRPQDRVVRRRDLEILLVRAGLDSHTINVGYEELMASALRSDAHVEFINYPEGQHAFDAVDNTARSKEIILQTVDFFTRNLLGDNSEPKSTLITNRQLWSMVVNENRTDEAIDQFKIAYDVHRKDPSQIRFFNQLLNENNLTGLGYQVLATNRIDDAIKIFTVNTEYFPDSPNTFDALSDAYEKKGDKTNTLLNAKLAIQKLEKATNLSPQFANAIRESAQNKINAIEHPEPDNIPQKRAHHALVYDGGSKSVLMTAGSTPLNGGQSYRFFNDLWRYGNSTWSKVGTAGDERSGIGLAYDSKRNKLYSFGGFTGNNQSSGQLRVLENGEWKILSDVPEMKVAEPGFVYDAHRDKLIAFGGSAARGQLSNVTWEWDGSSWKKIEGPGPGGRQGFVMVYDAKRKRTVLFGGMGATPQQAFSDTWEFDGAKWTKVSENGPGRMAFGFAYDSKRGMLVIFGGMSEGKTMGDTWSWNGKEWKKLSDTGPGPRSMGYMAYDQARDRIVLFGGRLGWPNDANDTWEWDGKQWQEIKSKP